MSFFAHVVAYFHECSLYSCDIVVIVVKKMY